jgi:hypothetical protein
MVNQDWESPFRYLLSFHKLADFWRGKAKHSAGCKTRYARYIVSEIGKNPVLEEGVEDWPSLLPHVELLNEMTEAILPAAASGSDLKALTAPFRNAYFLPTEAFENVFRDNEAYDLYGYPAEHLYKMKCLFILSLYHKIELDVNFPIIIDVRHKDGIVRYYRAVFNLEYLEALQMESSKIISEEEIYELLDNFDNTGLWKEKFPADSWLIKGFMLISLTDVTKETSLSMLKSIMVKSRQEIETDMASPDELFRSIFNIKSLTGAVYIYDNDKNFFELIDSYDKSVFLDDLHEVSKKEFRKIFDDILLTGKPFIISDAGKLDPNIFSDFFERNHIRSFVFYPLEKYGKILGILFFSSENRYEINSLLDEKIALISPLLIDTLERVYTEMETRIDAVIQKEYTSIHESVYWKFRTEIKNKIRPFRSPDTNKQSEVFNEIIFNEVYPLYGQIDIKGSSDKRNEVIKKDLRDQLNSVLALLDHFQPSGKVPVIEKIKFELNKFAVQLEKSFQNNLEQNMLSYLRSEVHPLFRKVNFPKEKYQLLNSYLHKLDRKTEIFYNARRLYDETVTRINSNFAEILDERQQQAQEIYPHYYERFKTDGVEYNLYIGQSISENKEFHKIYFDNLRLWQLETLCEMETEHELIRTSLPYPMEVTSLILAFSMPIAIRFRMDEKRFDVDGSYNAKYEVVKKRIDKAHIKNSNERITQPGKITIVYTHSYEAEEYEKYITFLQHKGLLENKVEHFEIEDLQGISGLQGLRVNVNHFKIDVLNKAKSHVASLLEKGRDPKFTYPDITHAEEEVREAERLCREGKTEFNGKINILLAAWFRNTGLAGSPAEPGNSSADIAGKFLSGQHFPPEDIAEVKRILWVRK